MKKLHIGAILLGGLFVMPFQAALAQTTTVAYANESRPGYVMASTGALGSCRALRTKRFAGQRPTLIGPPGSSAAALR
jgi:hypothetical protein